VNGPTDAIADAAVRLEPLAASHVNDLVAAVQESLAELSPWLPWAHPAYGARDATDFLRGVAHDAAHGTHRQYAVLDPSRRFVGALGLRVSDEKNGVAQIGYWIRTSATRRGHASAAVRAAASFAITTMGIGRIEIVARPENVASRRAAERAGAKFECIARNRIVQHGVAYPAALYSIVPEDLGLAVRREP
jgi:ribosomal-protein-serine acetyltransferase